jgi:SAM-dependent methyltransferase
MTSSIPLIQDELEVLSSLVKLDDVRLIELGCGSAGLASAVVARYLQTVIVGLEVDERQLAKNLATPQPRLSFFHAGAQVIPFADGCFDGAMMLKSLHHVPLSLMDQALGEVARVLLPGGWLYVSEPVYDGPLNDIVRLFNDEGEVRLAAQQALDRAQCNGVWEPAAERRFELPVHFADFATFEQRMMRPTYANHHIDELTYQRVRQRFESHKGPQGVFLQRPMYARLLRRCG